MRGPLLFDFAILNGQFRINFVPMSEIVSEGGMRLREREVRIMAHDFPPPTSHPDPALALDRRYVSNPLGSGAGQVAGICACGGGLSTIS